MGSGRWSCQRTIGLPLTQKRLLALTFRRRNAIDRPGDQAGLKSMAGFVVRQAASPINHFHVDVVVVLLVTVPDERDLVAVRRQRRPASSPGSLVAAPPMTSRVASTAPPRAGRR
jgi:hypothetical protein